MQTFDDSTTVEVYNADFRLHEIVGWRRAVSLLRRRCVQVVEPRSPAVFVNGLPGRVELPSSVHLIRFVARPHAPVRPTRERVLRRDGHLCGYCGGRATTIDHVLPRSRGGADVWINLVSACETCNGRKADRLPHEAGMSLIREPFEPRDADRFVPVSPV